MITLDSDRIASLLVWEDGVDIDYSDEDIRTHGLRTTYEVICDSYADDCEVEFFDSENEYLGCTSIGKIRDYLYGGAE